jgi:hypothetical protein
MSAASAPASCRTCPGFCAVPRRSPTSPGPGHRHTLGRRSHTGPRPCCPAPADLTGHRPALPPPGAGARTRRHHRDRARQSGPLSWNHPAVTAGPGRTAATRRLVPRGHSRPIRRHAERQDQAAGDPAAGPHRTRPSRGHTRGPSHPPSAGLGPPAPGGRGGCTAGPRPPRIPSAATSPARGRRDRQPVPGRPLFNQASDRRCPACHSRSGHGARCPLIPPATTVRWRSDHLEHCLSELENGVLPGKTCGAKGIRTPGLLHAMQVGQPACQDSSGVHLRN